MAAPVITPVQPKGMNGFQFSGLMKKSPSIMKNRITASLMKTIMLLTCAFLYAYHEQGGDYANNYQCREVKRRCAHPCRNDYTQPGKQVYEVA